MLRLFFLFIYLEYNRAKLILFVKTKFICMLNAMASLNKPNSSPHPDCEEKNPTIHRDRREWIPCAILGQRWNVFMLIRLFVQQKETTFKKRSLLKPGFEPTTIKTKGVWEKLKVI